MRSSRILHPQLAAALATLGHTDIVLVTDAGFPIPATANRIDLGFWPGYPDVVDILKVLRQELFVEDVKFAREVKECNPAFYQQLQDIYTGSGADFSEASHETLCDDIAHKAKVIIRSGSFNPWANIALVASTDPFAWFDTQSQITPLPAYVTRRERIENRYVPSFK